MTDRKPVPVKDFDVALYEGEYDDEGTNPLHDRAFSLGVGENFFWNTTGRWTGTIAEMVEAKKVEGGVE
jgi:hypothetical protein